MQNRIAFENALARAVLEEITSNLKIKSVLTEIANTLHLHVFTRAIEDMKKITKTDNVKKTPMDEIISSWAIQHSKGDMCIGALLPNHTLDELRSTTQGQESLLSAMANAFSAENIQAINSPHDVIALIKAFDSMGYYYLSDAYSKLNPEEYEKIKSMIMPSVEEIDMRCPRDNKMLATTYGIDTELNKDLIPQKSDVAGCFSGKARFFVPSAKERFEKLCNQFDQAEEKAKPALASKLSYYDIPLNKNERHPIEIYANRHTPWFQKLAKEKDSTESLPLIASASSSTSRSLITLLHLGAFQQTNNAFDLNKAQIYANCLMGYYVFCGHHSFLEVMEIWNRVLDYVAIYHPEQLPSDIFHKKSFDDKPDTNCPLIEELLPYGRIGDYQHFLHADYADRILKNASKYLNNQESWLPLTKHLHVLGQGIFKRTSQRKEELANNLCDYKENMSIKKIR